MQQPKVITVTLTPTLERTVVTNFLAIGYRNSVTEPVRLEAAGHGLNIARACHQMRCATESIIVLGHDTTAEAYQTLLAEEAFETVVLAVHCTTNSEVVIYDTGHQNETRIADRSASLSADDVTALGELLKTQTNTGDYVVFAGDLPYGVALDTYAYLTDIVQAEGAKVVLVTDGKALEHALKAEPELVMLNNAQLEGYFNYPVRTMTGLVACAQKLQAEGALRVLIIDDEHQIAVLVDEEDSWFVGLPEEARGTSSGAWDALLAGYLIGRTSKRALDVSLELGAAAAAYTINHIGNEFGTIKDIKRYTEEIQVVPVEQAEQSPRQMPPSGE